MSKQVLALLAVSFFIALLPIQALKAQTNTAHGTDALISNTTGIYNSAFGFQALRANTTGSENSAFGANTLRNNTTASFNTAGGYGALFSNVTGYNNTAHGHRALVSNTTGSFNTAYGVDALFHNTTADGNTATGYQALYSNTTGYENTANGFRSLYSNTVGFGNTSIGFESLLVNTTGTDNTASGRRSLYSNTTGVGNTANGNQALAANNTGYTNAAFGADAMVFNTTGYLNTAIGGSTLKYNTTGYYNTAGGSQALIYNTTGILNTATGVSALLNNNTGQSNTGIGAIALLNNTTGNNNVAVGVGAGNAANPSNSTFIGTAADATTTVDNSTALGYGATVWGNNQVRIGNTAVTSIGGQVGWTTFSDGRYKENINQNVPGLVFMEKLIPITYTVNTNGIDSKLAVNKPSSNDKAAKAMAAQPPSAEEQKSKAGRAKIVYTGFEAQKVEEAAKKINYDFSGVDVPKNKEDLYGLRYETFIPSMVKAIQELSAENKELKRVMQRQINDLKETVAKLMNGQPVTTKGANTTTTRIDAYLEQNAPNPLSGSTIIRYHLPSSAGSARIIITNMEGQTLKSINLNSKGDGQVTINAGTLAAGSYSYSLWVDGIQSDAKQMLIQK